MSEKFPKLIERFKRFVKVDTRSNEESTSTPSDLKEVAFLKELADELQALGLSDVQTMADGYVFAKLPANVDSAAVPTIGFISHVDTADFESRNVQPQEVKNYDGASIISLSDSGYVLDSKDFPNLKNYKGHDLITTDGRTLLGADDKAGVAEIFALIDYLMAHPEVSTGLWPLPLVRMKKSGGEQTSLMWSVLALILPIQWMVVHLVNWNGKPLTLRVPRLILRVATFIQVRPKIPWLMPCSWPLICTMNYLQMSDLKRRKGVKAFTIFAH